jgi:hypothetical protein
MYKNQDRAEWPGMLEWWLVSVQFEPMRSISINSRSKIKMFRLSGGFFC